ncbi:hypothetical protein AM440_04390 [Escherichia coli]|nr:hypothetical protein AM440_04390 [Escherichia coli]
MSIQRLRVLMMFSWPKSLSVAIGGGVGLIGVDAIRGAAMRVIGNKFGAHKE